MNTVEVMGAVPPSANQSARPARVILLVTIGEYDRRGWGEGGHDFHWWCTDSDEAFSGSNPTYKYLRDEIVEMVGKKVYNRMVELLERPQWTPLPHPAVTTRR